MIGVSRMNNVIPIAVKNDGRKRLAIFDSTRRGSALSHGGERRWPAHFAAVHKAALANGMLRYRPAPEYKVDEAAECGSAACHCEFK